MKLGLISAGSFVHEKTECLVSIIRVGDAGRSSADDFGHRQHPGSSRASSHPSCLQSNGESVRENIRGIPYEIDEFGKF